MPALAVAAIGAGATLYASNQQSKAADKAIAAQQAATDKTLAAQQAAAAQIRADQTPYRNAGYTALDALMQRYGLATPSSGSTGSATASTPSTGYYDASGRFIDNAPGAEAGSTAPKSTSYSAYEAANPDLAAEAARVVGSDPRFATKADYYAWHDANYASENRPSYTDPTQTTTQAPAANPNALTPQQELQQQIGTRPTFTRPDTGNAPSAPDLSVANYQKSPGYDFQMKEGLRALSSQFGARGLLKSGTALKGALGYSQGLADQDYNTWAQRQLGIWQQNLGQFNADRANTNNNFASDRQYGTGVFDADRNYLTGRYDNTTAGLTGIANMGQGANNQLASAATNLANNSSNAYQTNANNLSSAYGQQADANASGVNALAGQLQNLFANYNQPRFTSYGDTSVGQLSVSPATSPITNVPGLTIFNPGSITG